MYVQASVARKLKHFLGKNAPVGGNHDNVGLAGKKFLESLGIFERVVLENR